MRLTGEYCPTGGCFGRGYKEMAGLCACCWSRLSEEKRGILRDVSATGPRPITHEHHEHHHPPQSRILTTCIAFASGMVGGAVGLIAFQWGHLKGWW